MRDTQKPGLPAWGLEIDLGSYKAAGHDSTIGARTQPCVGTTVLTGAGSPYAIAINVSPVPMP